MSTFMQPSRDPTYGQAETTCLSDSEPQMQPLLLLLLFLQEFPQNDTKSNGMRPSRKNECRRLYTHSLPAELARKGRRSGRNTEQWRLSRRESAALFVR